MKQTAKKNIKLRPHEVFAKVEEATKLNDKADILRENATFAIKTILQANYKDEVKFDLPAGTPPYNEDKGPVGNQVSNIDKRIKTLANLIVQNKRLNKIQKETTFIKLLETVHAEDAKILIAMKDKKLDKLYKNLTEAVVRRAFPNLLPEKE